MKGTEGFIVVDPGWRNLGVLLLVVDWEEKKLEIHMNNFDLFLSKTKETRPEKLWFPIWDHVAGWIDERSTRLIPLIQQWNLIIEIQPPNRKKNVALQRVIETVLCCRFSISKVYRYTAYKAKNILCLPYGDGNHKKHKQDMKNKYNSKYPTDCNGDNLIFCEYADGTFEDHILDCFALLHTFYSSGGRKRELKTAVGFYVSHPIEKAHIYKQ